MGIPLLSKRVARVCRRRWGETSTWALLAVAAQAVSNQALLDRSLTVNQEMIGLRRAPHWEIGRQGCLQGERKRNGAVAVVFSLAHSQPLCCQIDVAQSQITNLTDAQTCLTEQIEPGAVQQVIPLSTPGCLQQRTLELLVVISAEKTGQSVPPLGTLHAEDRSTDCITMLFQVMQESSRPSIRCAPSPH